MKPRMNAEVKDYVSKCSICQTHQPEREPLKSYDPAYDLPQRPWSVVGEDPFQLGQQQFLLIVYYWSGFFEVQELSKVTSKTAITASKGPICETRNSGLPNLQYWPQYMVIYRDHRQFHLVVSLRDQYLAPLCSPYI